MIKMIDIFVGRGEGRKTHRGVPSCFESVIPLQAITDPNVVVP